MTDDKTKGRWIVRGPNMLWHRHPTKEAAIDSSGHGDEIYYEQDDGELKFVRKGLKTSQTQLR